MTYFPLPVFYAAVTFLSFYGQVQIKCDEMPKNEVSQFMENVCPFCAAEFVISKKCNGYTTYTY